MSEGKSLRILFLANWPAPNRPIDDGYAFFRHFRTPPQLRFLGTFRIPIWTWLEKRLLKFYLLQPLVALFLCRRFDVILAYSSQCALPLALLLRLFYKSHPPLVVFDVETFGRPRSGVRLALTRFALSGVDHVVYAATGQKKFYDQYLPMLSERSTYIPIGIGPYEKQKGYEEVRDSDYIVAIGKHGSNFRDWQTLLEGFLPMSERIALTIVGRRNLEKKDRGGVAMPPNVRLHPYMPIDQLAKIVEGARFAVLPLPQRHQSAGQLSILFLMAMGKTVIASRVVGLSDYIEPDVTGLFFEPGNAQELTKCIERFLNDPDLAVRMGKNARKAVEEKFNDRRMGQQWEACLAALLNDH